MRCPVCKAENPTGPSCRRCRADLTLLVALEEQREALLSRAREALRTGHWQQAQELAARAIVRRADATAYQLLAVSQLLQRHFAGAWRSYRTGQARAGGPPG